MTDMLEAIEKLLILQDRDRQIHADESGTGAHPNRSAPNSRPRASGAQGSLDAAKLRVKHIESDRKKTGFGGRGQEEPD